MISAEFAINIEPKITATKLPPEQQKTREAGEFRKQRRIIPIITDYLPDEKSLEHSERVQRYTQLKDGLGIQAVKTEFRMSHLLRQDETFDEATVTSYKESLTAMKEAGLKEPTIVLFTPPDWWTDMLKENPKKADEVYGNYVAKVTDICRETGTAPMYIQVMNEVNMGLQSTLPLETVVNLVKKTKEQFASDNMLKDTKIATTVLVDALPEERHLHDRLISFLQKRVMSRSDWKSYTKNLIARCGDSLDAVGFDFYPGTYDYPAGVSIIGKKPFEAFAVKNPYEWIVEEKQSGVLAGKDLFIAETGAVGLSHESRLQQYGYARIIQSLDHFLLRHERPTKTNDKGERTLDTTHPRMSGNDIFSAVMFFTGGAWDAVETKAPGKVDFTPWTLIRKNGDESWASTKAGEKLKHLIDTRIYYQEPKASVSE